jgi:serine/threonine-protein kinase
MLDANPGSIIANRYRLTRKLGQGGMGSVWQVEDRVLRIDVALKLVDPLESTDILARFEREAHAAARLRSTHIVHINDYGIDQASGTPYIAMDLLEGEDLSNLLRRHKRLAFEHTRRILLQVAQALRLAHEKKIVHRDLKPDNVFIAREGDLEIVKVLDFGIAKRLDTRSVISNLETQAGQVLGTPHYMSPEQAQAKRNIDYRTDIWSFGVIAYECVTGQRPFDEQNPAAVIVKICGESRPVPSQVVPVPAGFDAWFARAVARDRDERFSSIEEAAALLAAIGPQAVPHFLAAARAPQRVNVGATPANGMRSAAARGAASTSPASLAHARRRQRPWFVPAALSIAFVIAATVCWSIATSGPSLAAAGTPSVVASVSAQAASVVAAPSVSAATAEVADTPAESLSQVAAVSAPPAPSSTAPLPVKAKKPPRKRPTVAAGPTQQENSSSTEPAPKPVSSILSASLPEEYDPGI